VRLLVITPKVDPNDDLFGHVHGWLEALARRVDRLYVVGLWATDPPLPANARFVTLGKDSDDDKVRWLARLQRIVWRLCRSGDVDAILAHMGPVFAVAAAPLARLTRTPLFLWYAHGHVSPMLHLAHAAVDGVGTSTTEGFRIPSDKVTITGQGIDMARFHPPSQPHREPGEPARILSVGRFSPIKDYATLLDAVARLPLDAGAAPPTAELLGGVHSMGEQLHLASLRSKAADLGIGERVTFVEGVPHARIVPIYQRADLFATCSQTGSLDKVVLEAAACGVVPLVCNDAFRDLFGDHWPALSFPPGDADALAGRLAAWLARDAAERRDVAGSVRVTIGREHSVEHLADAIVGMIGAR